MDDHKKGVQRALNKYLERQEPKVAGPKRHYEKPEKEVEKACLKWMRDRGWNVQIFEAKATFSEAAGRYISQAMKAGSADCMGHLPDGVGAIVEFKAPGRLSSYAAEKNYRQQQFINDKIDAGCFACVVDSVERLSTIYNEWVFRRGAKNSLIDSKTYLKSQLPKRSGRSKYDKDLDL